MQVSTTTYFLKHQVGSPCQYHPGSAALLLCCLRCALLSSRPSRRRKVDSKGRLISSTVSLLVLGRSLLLLLLLHQQTATSVPLPHAHLPPARMGQPALPCGYTGGANAGPPLPPPLAFRREGDTPSDNAFSEQCLSLQPLLTQQSHAAGFAVTPSVLQPICTLHTVPFLGQRHSSQGTLLPVRTAPGARA